MAVFRSIFFLSLIRLFRPRSRAQGGTLAPGSYPVFGGTYSLKTHRLPGWGKDSIRSPPLRYWRVSRGRNSLRPAAAAAPRRPLPDPPSHRRSTDFLKFEVIPLRPYMGLRELFS